MRIERLDRRHAGPTVALLGDLRVSLLGLGSRRLHTVLANDGVNGRIECRIASDSDQVKGVVLAAPASYWRWLPLTHWGIGIECIRVRMARRRPPAPARADLETETLALLETGNPPRTWRDPGDAWRIIFIGTAADARGKGIAAQLYRSLMADRSLVARVALHNTPSIRLHHSLGWRLYRDGAVALAVHGRHRQPIPGLRESKVAPHEDGPPVSGSYRRASALRCGWS